MYSSHMYVRMHSNTSKNFWDFPKDIKLGNIIYLLKVLSWVMTVSDRKE